MWRDAALNTLKWEITIEVQWLTLQYAGGIGNCDVECEREKQEGTETKPDPIRYDLELFAAFLTCDKNSFLD